MMTTHPTGDPIHGGRSCQALQHKLSACSGGAAQKQPIWVVGEGRRHVATALTVLAWRPYLQ